MNCLKCNAENTDTAKFCNECGTPLTAGGSQPQDQSAILRNYIPKELAERMISAGKVLESERRVVTVLFADVTGFTAISEKLDPEQVTTILNECFRGLIDIVYRYEGFIDKFIGDEIMAIFGAPITHENDPERAIRCSQEMLSYISRFNTLSPVSLPQPLGIHIGINSGMVVAGNVGSDLRMNYSVIGDTVNLAARLVGYAKSGQIITSETTFNAVHNIIKVGEPEVVTLKGKSEPVKVYPIIGIDETSLPGERQLQKTSFIGRTDELDLFKRACASLMQNKGTRLFVRGEAGVGKSRLKLEFKNIAEENSITMYEGKCSSFETNTPYYLWSTLLKSILGIDREAPEKETRQRLHDMLQILGIQKNEPYLAALLSLRYEQILLEEDEHRKAKIFESVMDLFKSLSTRKKIMIVFEDLHWVDKFSDTLLQYVFSQLQPAPVIFIFLYRGEYQQSETLLHRGGELIDLNRLSHEEAFALIRLRLQVNSVPTNLTELIYKRSEGNPFFIEEIIRTMLDRKSIIQENGKLTILEKNISDIVPDTVQGIIMSRIDRLEEKMKDILLQASVIGREFSRPVLEKVTSKTKELSSSLNALNTLELILPKEEAKELEYLFKHYLIQEVAYNTLLIKKRKELHGKIARAIEALYADQLRDYYELLSFHYEKAEEWEKAAEYLSRTGSKVREIYTKEESQQFYERKEEALEQLFSSKATASSRVTKFLTGIVVVLSLSVAIIFVGMATHNILDRFDIHVELLNFKHHDEPRIRNIQDDLFVMLFGLIWVYLPIRIIRMNKGINTLQFYEVQEDNISLIYKGGTKVSLPFTEIQEIHFVRKKYPLLKKIAKEASVLGITHQPVMGEFRLNAKLPMFIGSEAGTYIYIRKNIGKENGLTAQLKLKSNPEKIIKQIRNIALTPVNTSEFYEQLSVAFTKWESGYCHHCRASHKNSGECPQCRYVGRLAIPDNVDAAVFHLHPVQNIFIDLLEILFFYFLCVVFLGLVIKIGDWPLFILILIFTAMPVVNLFLRFIFKRRTENRMEISISETAVIVKSGNPYFENYITRMQDILSIKRYANVYQRMFGLSNIELELRKGLPLTNEGPLYYAVLPSIKDGSKIEEFIKSNCKFLKDGPIK